MDKFPSESQYHQEKYVANPASLKKKMPRMLTQTRLIKIKKPYVHFIIKIFLIENECKTPKHGLKAFLF